MARARREEQSPRSPIGPRPGPTSAMTGLSARGTHTQTHTYGVTAARLPPRPHLALLLLMRFDPGTDSFLYSGAPSASLPKARQIGSASALSEASEAGFCLQSPRLRGGAVAMCVMSSGRPGAPSPAAVGARGRLPASAAGPRCREEARARDPGRKGGCRLGGREQGSSRASSPCP